MSDYPIVVSISNLLFCPWKKSFVYNFLSRHIQLFIPWYPTAYPLISWYKYFLSIDIQFFFTNIHVLIHEYPTAYLWILCYLSFLVHWYPDTCPFISFLFQWYSDIYPSGDSIWFSAIPAYRGVQLDQPSFVHHRGKQLYFSIPAPRCGHRRPPGQQRRRHSRLRRQRRISASCHSRQDARMGQKLGGPVDDHPGSPDAESWPERRGSCLAREWKDSYGCN